MLDVQSRWEQLHNTMPALRLYALVDGVQYQTQLCKRFQPGSGLFPLFAGTPDAALAHAGPWLVDTAIAGEATVAACRRTTFHAGRVSVLMMRSQKVMESLPTVTRL